MTSTLLEQLAERPAERLSQWLAEQRRACRLVHRRIELPASRAWRLEDGAIVHRTGGFFSLVGLRARSDHAGLDGLQQPIILQPEIGILGFLVRHPGEGAELLVQAKAEPGNVREVQLAPTVQATFSNYTRKHGGAATAFLGHFTGKERSSRVLADVLQSEQGTRFLGKYNRNMTVAVAGAGSEPSTGAFRWVKAPQLLGLLHVDFAVNTDARSTLVCSDWRALAPEGRPFLRWRGRGGLGEELLRSWEAPDDAAEHRGKAVRARLEALCCSVRLATERVPLEALCGWTLDARGLRERHGSSGAVAGPAAAAATGACAAAGTCAGAGAGFEVRFFDVSCAGREVERWDQPLVAATREEQAVLLVQRRRGVLHLLLRGSAEIGFRERVQFGPTAQSGVPGADTGALAAFCLGHPDLVTHADARQSDEGGRFFRTVVRYRIREAPEDDPVPADPAAIWATLAQAHALTRVQGCLTNEARSLLSLLLPWL
jgi:oxidase EvaA